MAAGGQRRPKVVDHVRKMTAAELLQTWQNARRIVRESGRLAADAKVVCDAVVEEMNYRYIFYAGNWFPWPNTEPKGASTKGGFTRGWRDQGVLSLFGYHVGVTNGVPKLDRQAILREVFEGTIPAVFPRYELDQWDKPAVAGRLKRIVYRIAEHVVLAKRKRSQNMDEAIREWEQDLDWLYRTYYVSKFNFDWPDTDLDIVDMQGGITWRS